MPADGSDGHARCDDLHDQGAVVFVAQRTARQHLSVRGLAFAKVVEPSVAHGVPLVEEVGIGESRKRTSRPVMGSSAVVMAAPG
jgi:hypothetical protein